LTLTTLSIFQVQKILKNKCIWRDEDDAGNPSIIWQAGDHTFTVKDKQGPDANDGVAEVERTTTCVAYYREKGIPLEYPNMPVVR
jgi:hypothetical protein